MTDRSLGALALVAASALVLAPLAWEHQQNRGAAPLPRDQVGAPFAFAREIDRAVTLELPAASRPALTDEDQPTPIQGPFHLIRTAKGVSTYTAALPVRPRSLFFSKPLPGMDLLDKSGKKLSFSTAEKQAQPRSWSFDAESVTLRLPASAPAPGPGDFSMIYPKAVERERALNLSFSGLSAREFAARSLQLGTDTRTGLLLPAPATAAWDLTVPAAATLQLDAVVLPPEVQAELRSDGATLVVEIEENGAKTEVLREDLTVGAWKDLRADLSDYAGHALRLSFRTEGGDTDTLDYVFLAEPTLYTPTTQPRKLLLVFLDTTRRDHLGLYGYERDTTPKLDAWSKSAFVFDNAHSVAPWTLPSSRTIFSGRQPERWTEGPTLPERLAKAGWATGAFIGNIYLSSNFDMADGWSQHTCSNWPLAEVQVERVHDFLDRHEGRDVAVVLHTMDTHVPYTEPAAYRNIWAGPPPSGLGENPVRSSILKAAAKDKEGVRSWLIDRYDQNLRYLDDQVSSLIEAMGPDTTVVIFADHGEEFWDHDDFEHGHSLYDELLRVPLIVYDPSLPGGRSQSPVSLLDLTPTVLELLGLPVSQVDGRSLLSVARGDYSAATYFMERPQAIGRPLYGTERWGVISDNKKWTTHEGAEALYDLAADAAETRNLQGQEGQPGQEALRGELSRALNTPVPLSWRVEVGRTTGGKARTVEIRHPQGIAAAWLGADPLDGAALSVSGPDAEGVVRLVLPAARTTPRELYLVPAGPPELLGGLSFTYADDTQTADPELVLDSPKGRSARLWSTRVADCAFEITWGFAPIPPGQTELNGTNAELNEALQALGYQERDE